VRHFRLLFRSIIVFGLQRFSAGVVFALALASQRVLRGSCMDPSFDPVIRYHTAWQPVDVNDNLDFVRWDNWSTLRVLPTVCWQLGGLEQNLVVYTFWICFPFPICVLLVLDGLLNSLTTRKSTSFCAEHVPEASTFLDTLVGDPPVQH